MKIAVCLFKYFPFGGLQRDFVEISTELQRRGHEVVVYTGEWDGPRVAELKDVRILPAKGLGNHQKNRCFAEYLKTALKKESVDLVFGFNKMPGLDLYFCADTCFATKAFEEKGWLYRITPRCRWSLKYEKAVVGVDSNAQILLLSAAEGEAFKKYYQTPEERLHLIPPGIQADRIRHEHSDQMGSKMRETLGIPAGNKVIAFLGSDYKRKGLDRIIISVASLSVELRNKVSVIVIGRDKHMPEFQTMVEKYNLEQQFIFVGQSNEVPALLFASNLLVHPAYLENSGNAILEAVVAGLPVLCTEKCGNATYIMEEDLGWAIPEPFDQQVMNSMLHEALCSQENWQERCARFAAKADIYSGPNFIADFIENMDVV